MELDDRKIKMVNISHKLLQAVMVLYKQLRIFINKYMAYLSIIFRYVSSVFFHPRRTIQTS